MLNPAAFPSHSLSPPRRWDWASPAFRQLPQSSPLPEHEGTSPVCRYPIRNTKSGKCGLNLLLSQAHTAPSSGKIMSICWSPPLQENRAPLSQTEVKKGEGAGGGLFSPPLLMGLCRKRPSSGEGEAAQRHGCMAGRLSHIFYPYFRGFVLGLCCALTSRSNPIPWWKR